MIGDVPPTLAGSWVASASTTSGASSPLAPWTVITRTALDGADGSRFTSTSPWPNQARKRSSEAISSLLERKRACDQFLDRIARRLAKPPEQLAPSVERARQDRLQKARRSDIVRHRQPVRQDGMRLGQMRLFLAAALQLGPQPAFPALRQIVKLLLVPTDERRNQQRWRD